MDVRVSPTSLQGVWLIEPEFFQDERGFFMESYHKRQLQAHGIDIDFVQDNHSRSVAGVVRGFHYQAPPSEQHRLVRCTAGAVLDVVIDIRADAATFGRWAAFELTAENKKQLLMGPAFAHGFAVLSETAEVQYKCSNHHDASAERTLAWDDPELAVKWPFESPILSEKDRTRGMSVAAYLEQPDFR